MEKGKKQKDKKIYQANTEQKNIALVTIISENGKFKAIFYKAQKRECFIVLKRTR